MRVLLHMCVVWRVLRRGRAGTPTGGRIAAGLPVCWTHTRRCGVPLSPERCMARVCPTLPPLRRRAPSPAPAQPSPPHDVQPVTLRPHTPRSPCVPPPVCVGCVCELCASVRCVPGALCAPECGAVPGVLCTFAGVRARAPLPLPPPPRPVWLQCLHLYSGGLVDLRDYTLSAVAVHADKVLERVGAGIALITVPSTRLEQQRASRRLSSKRGGPNYCDGLIVRLLDLWLKFRSKSAVGTMATRATAAPRTPHPAPRTPRPAPRARSPRPHPAPRTPRPHPAPRAPRPAPRAPHPAPRAPRPAPRNRQNPALSVWVCCRGSRARARWGQRKKAGATAGRRHARGQNVRAGGQAEEHRGAKPCVLGC